MMLIKFFANNKPLSLFTVFWLSAMLILGIITAFFVDTSTLAGWWFAAGSLWFLILSLITGLGVVAWMRGRKRNTILGGLPVE